MKKVTFVITTTVLSAFIYFGSISQPVAASSNDGILSDSTKKEKPVKSEEPESTATDSTKTE